MRCSALSTRYTESNGHPSAHGRYNNVEWFAQDTWRVSRRVTIDAGVRFYYIKPTISAGDKLGAFDLATYNRSTTAAADPAVYRRRAESVYGRDPVSGALVPAVKIGTFSTAAGTPFQGTLLYKEGLMNTPPIQVAPRIGLLGTFLATARLRFEPASVSSTIGSTTTRSFSWCSRLRL